MTTTEEARTPGQEEAVTILYTNYRGETAVRRITPIAREWFGSSDWHPEPQWLFTAFDMEKEAFRDFARSGVKAWGQAAVDAALATPRADSDEPHFGYLFHNPDTGEEWSESHPIESGEVEDAENVRPATAKALHELLIEAWSALEDARADLYSPAPSSPGVPDSVRAPTQREIDLEEQLREAVAFLEMDKEASEPGSDLYTWLKVTEQFFSTRPAGQSTGQGAEPRRMAEGCCSAVSPCSHQQRDPYSLCAICQKANGLTDKIQAGAPDSTRTGPVGAETSAREIIPFKANYRHKKTGGLYQTLDVVTNGTNGEANGQKMVLYTNGMKSFAREYSEFFDGRFERIQPSEALAARPAAPEAQGAWQDISTAPPNKAVQVYVPNHDYYGNEGVYAGMLVDMGTGQRWMTFAWAMGRDMCGDSRPTHWRPLPAPPASSGQERA